MRTIKTSLWLAAIGVGLAIGLATVSRLRASVDSVKTLDSPLTASQVVRRMTVMADRRTAALRSYTSLRSYRLVLHGIINIHANMEVKMTYRYPGDKDFIILSEGGSGYVRNHVFKRMIEAETEASHQSENRRLAITPENYNFKLTGYKHNNQGQYYILKVTPKVKRKFLFDGRIWVNGRDYAIVRIEGRPSKQLSWWTPKVNFVYQYKKVGKFWFPASNKTITHVRIFGRSLLTIEYNDYDLTDARSVPPLITAEAPSSDGALGRSLLPARP